MLRPSAAVLALLALSCAPRAEVRAVGEPAPWSQAWVEREGHRFLEDTAYRRATLEASLTNPGNLYSRQRLGFYALGDAGWDLLPEWNPRSTPVTGELAARLQQGEAPVVPADTAVLWDGGVPQTHAAWVALGREVFFRYPMRAEPSVEYALTRPALAAAVGLERSADGAAPGLVVFADVRGEPRVGITCALCHSAVEGGAAVPGVARRALDFGKLRGSWAAATGVVLEPGLTRRMAAWGPGRADVTEDDDEDPVAIPDLWGLFDQRWLTQAGTIRQDTPVALAIRQETQLTDSNHQLVRPPRVLAWALALYVYSLVPPARVASPANPDGERLFARHCRGCHSNAALGGGVMPVEKIGTHPALANGRGRGTGSYRVPGLLRVGEGAPYLHDGSVSSLDELLSPERLAPGYLKGRLGPGPIEGHRAGTQLSAEERAALIAWLRTR